MHVHLTTDHIMPATEPGTGPAPDFRHDAAQHIAPNAVPRLLLHPRHALLPLRPMPKPGKTPTGRVEAVHRPACDNRIKRQRKPEAWLPQTDADADAFNASKA